MLAVPYYHSLLRKYVIVFGTLFNNIFIERFNDDGSIAQQMKVPISYGPREKFLARLELDPTGIPKTSIRLPRMAFEMINFQYAANRKLQTITKVYQPKEVDNKKTLDKVYTPVPYDITFNLYIMTKSTEDSSRIVEQILPYFTPEWTVGAKLLSGFDAYTDIPIVINSVNVEDTYEGSFTERRALIYTISFTMKAYLFGPTSKSKVIKIANVDFHIPEDIEAINPAANDVVSSVTVQPGLTANGEPTTSIDETIPYSQIEETDDYGYIVTKTDFPDRGT
jgi:hypothetical protein